MYGLARPCTPQRPSVSGAQVRSLGADPSATPRRPDWPNADLGDKTASLLVLARGVLRRRHAHHALSPALRPTAPRRPPPLFTKAIAAVSQHR